MTDKTAVSISEMARIVGLSRQRFHQLIQAGVFPAPLYDIATRRPFYNEEMQQTCLEVRRRNCGINGKAVLFYSRRAVTASRERFDGALRITARRVDTGSRVRRRHTARARVESQKHVRKARTATPISSKV
jgi:hypothetical protein